jgi:hypothetical protein
MLGIAKGLLADGIVVEEEGRVLHEWGANHPDALSVWPANLIFSRVQQFFADGRIDAADREELKGILTALVGGTLTIQLGHEGASTLPLDSPPPAICWHDAVFVFTGKFAYGTRAHCEREVLQRGGIVEPRINCRTSFLVIGTFSSEDWKHTSYGRKIEQAVALRDSGLPLRIVGEDHWANSMSPTASV